MGDNSNIPQFTRAAYQSWAFKVRFGLYEKKYHSIVMAWKGTARVPRPDVISPLTQAALGGLADAVARTAAMAARRIAIDTREQEIEAWDEVDGQAQAL